jgi:predicted DCC family thiol-disulfide oxidoreductase YuxK
MPVGQASTKADPDLAGRPPALHANYLLYDGECPACSAYVAISRLHQLYPDLDVISARDTPQLVADLRRAGYEINEGMVLSLGGRLYFGPEATRMIAVLGRTRPSAWRGALLALIGTAPWARRLYPWLNRTRLLLLRLLGRGPIA